MNKFDLRCHLAAQLYFMWTKQEFEDDPVKAIKLNTYPYIVKDYVPKDLKANLILKFLFDQVEFELEFVNLLACRMAASQLKLDPSQIARVVLNKEGCIFNQKLFKAEGDMAIYEAYLTNTRRLKIFRMLLVWIIGIVLGTILGVLIRRILGI